MPKLKRAVPDGWIINDHAAPDNARCCSSIWPAERRYSAHGPGGLEVGTAVVSGYGELAPVLDLIFHFRTGTAAERVPANINAFTKTRSFIQPIGLI